MLQIVCIKYFSHDRFGKSPAGKGVKLVHTYECKKVHKSERYFRHLLLAIFVEHTIPTNYFLW